jgi:methylmalonyl-CoA mutase N-terminal domain/subunit
MIESLTDWIETEAWQRIEKIDSLGGMLSAIEQRYPQGEIESSAYEAQRSVEQGASVVVGVNRYCESAPTEAPAVLKIDPKGEGDQIAKLAAYKAARDSEKASATLRHLESLARSDAELMTSIVECVRASCTLGEISDTLRGVFGEHKEI